MNVLILGGTQFIGRHIVETLLAAGHNVSILNRGRSRDEFLPRVERLRGDCDDACAALVSLTGALEMFAWTSAVTRHVRCELAPNSCGLG